MPHRTPARLSIWLLPLLLVSAGGHASEVKLLTRPADPYGSPRPGPGQEQVPLRASFYAELGMSDDAVADRVLPDSVSVALQPEGGDGFSILRAGPEFAAGYKGKLTLGKNNPQRNSLVVYIDPENELVPETRYTLRIRARSRDGAELPERAGTWHFTTEAAAATHDLSFELSLAAPPVRWQGGFFSGFCGTSFCTDSALRLPTFELMEQVRRTAPRAWSLQRDFWMTGMDHQPELLSRNLPNIVREHETRRVRAIELLGDGVRLRVEDFFGHEQYGIATGRPLAADYHAGDEVLVADGIHDARAKVVAVEADDHAVVVTAFDPPAEGWKLAYAAPLPRGEDTNAPGLFPPGGTYLRKLRPSGTPAYYWGRLDKQWDLAHRRFARRLVVNFADAPGDLAIDGRNWTTAKDYAELHAAVHAITSHIVERYGDACLEFAWSVFNEPDLGALFWRTDWNELQKFYDYTVDGILRAFEDHGYDSDRVFVGGLELGGIFGTNLRLREFLVHCSPRAAGVPGALLPNAAVADERLAGKRSRRVERLCRAHGGRGSPCDFVSVHAYNTSKLMADKLARAKQMAIETDAEYYERLWVNSHESCPGWDLPPDPAYADSYLGDGYYPTWCADVARRRLERARGDARYGYGETMLTFWPWPNRDFGGGNDCVREIQVDDNGDGMTDRRVTIAMPILHFLGLVSGMSGDFQVLPERVVGPHVVSGFASQQGGVTRILLYAHSALDTESRSAHAFRITLGLTGLAHGAVTVREYRFDKDHNSYFRLARPLRDADGAAAPPADAAARLERAVAALTTGGRASRRAALDDLAALGPAAASAAGAMLEFAQKSDDAGLRARAMRALERVTGSPPCSGKVARQLEERAALHTTGSATRPVGADGQLSLEIDLDANGANFLEIEPSGRPR